MPPEIAKAGTVIEIEAQGRRLPAVVVPTGEADSGRLARRTVAKTSVRIADFVFIKSVFQVDERNGESKKWK